MRKRRKTIFKTKFIKIFACWQNNNFLLCVVLYLEECKKNFKRKEKKAKYLSPPPSFVLLYEMHTSLQTFLISFYLMSGNRHFIPSLLFFYFLNEILYMEKTFTYCSIFPFECLLENQFYWQEYYLENILKFNF